MISALGEPHTKPPSTMTVVVKSHSQFSESLRGRGAGLPTKRAATSAAPTSTAPKAIVRTEYTASPTPRVKSPTATHDQALRLIRASAATNAMARTTRSSGLVTAGDCHSLTDCRAAELTFSGSRKSAGPKGVRPTASADRANTMVWSLHARGCRVSSATPTVITNDVAIPTAQEPCRQAQSHVIRTTSQGTAPRRQARSQTHRMNACITNPTSCGRSAQAADVATSVGSARAAEFTGGARVRAQP